MQKISLVILALISLFIPFHFGFSQSASPVLTITEIGAFESADTEWIEIFNQSGAPLDLTGWKFFEDQTNHGLTTAQGDATLEAGEFALIVNKADSFLQKYPAYSGTLLDSSWGSLKLEGEEIGLKDSSGNSVEIFTYPAAPAESSLEKIGGEWKPSPSGNTMGAAEAPSEPATTEPETAADSETSSTSTETAPPPDNMADDPVLPQSTSEIEAPAASEPVLNNTAVATSSVSENGTPVAVILIQSGNLTAYEQSTINFDGRNSSDPDGDALTYLWDMGDGTVFYTANPGPYTYRTPGTYTVHLTVTDTRGAQTRDSRTVQVLAQLAPPVTPTLISSAKPAAKSATNSSAGKKTSAEKTPKAAKAPAAIPSGTMLPPQAIMELRGYFVFIPEGSAPVQVQTKKIAKKNTSSTKTIAPAKKKKTPVKKKKAPVKKSPKKSSKKVATDENSFWVGRSFDDEPEEPTLNQSPVRDEGGVQITEIFPSPEDDGEEWIEIYNAGGAAANLAGWTLSDKAKTASPYRFPSGATLAPGSYLALPKSETRLSLNNSNEEVLLANARGETADLISYLQSKKGSSYARLRIAESRDFVASTEALPAREEEVWEWVADATPGEPNPVLEKISGKVTRGVAAGRLLAGGESLSFELTALSGKIKEIRVPPETIDPLMAELVFREGTNLEIHASPSAGGASELRKISKVIPPPEEKKTSIPFLAWIAIAAVIVGGLIQLPALIRWVRETAGVWYERRHRPSPVLTRSEKDNSAELEM